MRFKHWLVIFSAVAVLAGCNRVGDPTLNEVFDPVNAAPPIKTAVEPNPLRNVFWGDLHIHSNLSFDAFTMGVTATPDDAYTFAKGGTIAHALGYPINLSRPLDFAAVTDHAEYFGVANKMDPDNTSNRDLREAYHSGIPWRITRHFIQTTVTKMMSVEKREEVFGASLDRQTLADTWKVLVDTADRHNYPGTFTALAGYEWTSMPGGQNLHRNIIYRDSHVPEVAFSSRDSNNPMDLWAELDRQREQGMQMIAIPHNSNVSNGKMYDRVDFNGNAMGSEYAATRMRNEPISEILQVKGASETHPVLSSEDEFANFEILNEMLSSSGEPSQPAGSYARDALRTGMEMQHSQGFNPYKFGFIGSSDGHNASSPVEEDNYHGKLPLLDGLPTVRLGEVLVMPESLQRGRRWSAAGLAAVWAEENTRASLFDAMQRRETYATSGPRISVRFFGGWDISESSLSAADPVAEAYASGVPMGGELSASDASGQAPGFAVWASRDPRGANLDRVQIIKMWVDAGGNSHEKVYDVATPDKRPRRADGSFEPVGNTVDVAQAAYSNTIGGPMIAAYWQDPDFDAGVDAAYYARVLEIPTPRWTTFDAKLLGIEAPEPTSLQERAITSAIWYNP